MIKIHSKYEHANFYTHHYNMNIDYHKYKISIGHNKIKITHFVVYKCSNIIKI